MLHTSVNINQSSVTSIHWGMNITRWGMNMTDQIDLTAIDYISHQSGLTPHWCVNITHQYALRCLRFSAWKSHDSVECNHYSLV